MKQIQNQVLQKITQMTELGILQWRKRKDDNLRWVKMKNLNMILSMDADIDSIDIETENGPMIIKGGTPMLKQAIEVLEREME